MISPLGNPDGDRPHAPRYNDALRLAKRIKRRADERMFRKTGLEVYRGMFVEECNNYQKQLEFYKSSYYKTRIKQAGRNELFQNFPQSVSTW